MRKKWYSMIGAVLFTIIIVGCTNASDEETSEIEATENSDARLEDEENETMEGEDQFIHPNESDKWGLTFEDTFEAENLDSSKWEHAPEWDRHAGKWSNQEAFLDGEGHLLVQINEKDGEYVSGAIRTIDLFEQTFGYFEIKANIPKEEGFWTAFWLMSEGVHTVGNEGKDGTEIDIFETPFASRGDIIQHALHWDGYEENHQSVGEEAIVSGVYEGFHTFGLEWNEEEYIFYIDEEETWRTSAGGVSQVPAYMKITAEVGEWAGDIEKAELPAQLMVDYVRVYTRGDE